MKTLSFELTMPNRGSWNGGWSGATKKYFITKIVADKIAKRILEANNYNNFYYSFGDGWGANVHVEIVDSKEAAKRRKISSGFWGYNWMVTSIILYNQIQTTN